MSLEGHTERAQPESSEKGAKREKRPRATDRGFDHGSVAEFGQTVFRPRCHGPCPLATGPWRVLGQAVARFKHGTVTK